MIEHIIDNEDGTISILCSFCGKNRVTVDAAAYEYDSMAQLGPVQIDCYKCLGF